MENAKLKEARFCPFCGSWRIQIDPLRVNNEEHIQLFCEDCKEMIFNTFNGFQISHFAITSGLKKGAIIFPVNPPQEDEDDAN